MLSGEFIRLLLLAQVIAWPAGYIAMRFWLGSFAYHSGMRVATFVLGGLLTSTIALAGVSIQMARAGMANPADTLRYE